MHLGCWDHARRKFVEAVKVLPKPVVGKPSVAMVALSKINALFRIEREIARLADDERFRERQKRVVPKLAQLKRWLDQKPERVNSFGPAVS